MTNGESTCLKILSYGYFTLISDEHRVLCGRSCNLKQFVTLGVTAIGGSHFNILGKVSCSSRAIRKLQVSHGHVDKLVKGRQTYADVDH